LSTQKLPLGHGTQAQPSLVQPTVELFIFPTGHEPGQPTARLPALLTLPQRPSGQDSAGAVPPRQYLPTPQLEQLQLCVVHPVVPVLKVPAGHELPHAAD